MPRLWCAAQNSCVAGGTSPRTRRNAILFRTRYVLRREASAVFIFQSSTNYAANSSRALCSSKRCSPIEITATRGRRAGKHRKQRAHHAHASPSGGGGLDDYFKEGEQKSLEQDNAPKPKGGLPPPPKMGGPPRGPPKSATPVQAEAEAEPEA